MCVRRSAGIDAFFEEFSSDSHAREGPTKGTRMPKKSGGRVYRLKFRRHRLSCVTRSRPTLASLSERHSGADTTRLELLIILL